MAIGIMGAMEEEVRDLLSFMTDTTKVALGSRTYHVGKIEGRDVVVCLSRIGKVASASTATTLLNHFKASSIIFTGVAGGVAPQIKIGDVVLASKVMQFDVDASPIMNFKRFEIPLLGKIYFDLCQDLRGKARHAIQSFLDADPGHKGAALHEGIIGSSDHFIDCPKRKEALIKDIPGLLAVEMEGGAVGQICSEWNVPLLLIRSISDTADHNSPSDFPKFLSEVAAPLSAAVVREVLRRD